MIFRGFPSFRYRKFHDEVCSWSILKIKVRCPNLASLLKKTCKFNYRRHPRTEKNTSRKMFRIFQWKWKYVKHGECNAHALNLYSRKKDLKRCIMKFISTLLDAWHCQHLIHSWTFSANKLMYVMYFSPSLQTGCKDLSENRIGII